MGDEDRAAPAATLRLPETSSCDRERGHLYLLAHPAPYSRGSYERTTTAITEQLVNTPKTTTNRHVIPLLRTFGVAARYSSTNR